MRSDPSGRRVSRCRESLKLLSSFRAVGNYAIAATCQKEPLINSRASNIPGQLLVAIESVVFFNAGFQGRETASKDPKPIVTYHLPFFISEVCIYDV
jgi:hypothetical protein